MLGRTVSPATAWAILKKAGFDPAPQRSDPIWAQFLRAQAPGVLACDFFSDETPYAHAQVDRPARVLGRRTLTVNEIRRLLAALIFRAEQTPDRTQAWSNWRRRRQAQGRRCHYKRRGHTRP
jgi:hypothetical protein